MCVGVLCVHNYIFISGVRHTDDKRDGDAKAEYEAENVKEKSAQPLGALSSDLLTRVFVTGPN